MRMSITLGRSVFRAVRQSILRFDQDERGGITIFILLMFLTMVVAAGMAVDFTRQESARADLQNALDRGTLAAADFAQTISDKEMVVQDYVRSSAIHSPDLVLNVAADSGTGFSRVTATGQYQINTFFLKIIGIDTLTVAAVGSAEQRKRKVEISMVLDVSGSMGWDSTSAPGSKLDQLKIAANDFVDTLLTAETLDDTSISVVPYSEYVRPSANLAAQFNLNTTHNYHNCFAFDHGDPVNLSDLGDFSQMGVSTVTVFQQAQRMKVNSSRYRCPRAANEIVALSNDAADLHTAINGLQSEGWTATFEGLKWGAALLDPNSNSVVSGLIAAGDVDSTFSDRPLLWTEEDMLKVLVVMTDGANTKQYRIDPTVYAGESSSYWNDNIADSDDLELLVDNDATGKGDALMHSICDLAKANDIIVYTIGFELNADPAAAAALAPCASAPDNHFLVEGVEIATAFETIAANIQKLKLIQ